MANYGDRHEAKRAPVVHGPANTLKQAKVAGSSTTGFEASGARGLFDAPVRLVELGPEDKPLSPLRMFNVREYGARGDGVADDTEAIQAAIDAAEQQMLTTTELVNDRVSASAWVYVPEGTYRITGLVVTCPIVIRGAGQLHSVLYSATNAPLFDVTLNIIRLYSPLTIEHLGICGDRSLGGKTAQHGIRVNSNALVTDASIDLRWCTIQGCGSNGLYFPDPGGGLFRGANTPRVFGCTFQVNWGDAINFSGAYATNARILHNVFTENRRGVNYDGTIAATNASAAYLYSGHIAFNLFESNTNGTGQVGSSTRPGVGVSITNGRNIVVEDNYFERQLNHVFLGVAGGAASSYCSIQRNFFSGVSLIPGEFPGFSGPAQRPCDIAIASGSCVGIVCRDNAHEIPTKPAATSVTDWSNAAWPNTLPVFAVIDGQQHVIDEGWQVGADVETANTPFFRRLADNGQESFGLTRGGTGLTLSPLDGTFAANEYVALTGQIAPYDTTGKGQIRFIRRADGGAFIQVYANDAASALQLCASFLGTEKAIQLGTGFLLDNATAARLLSNRKTGWAVATGTAARTTFATFAGQTISNPPTQAQVQAIDNHVVILSQRLKALIDDLHATAGHGLIGT